MTSEEKKKEVALKEKAMNNKLIEEIHGHGFRNPATILKDETSEFLDFIKSRTYQFLSMSEAVAIYNHSKSMNR